MTSGETEAFATRISAENAERTHEATIQTGLSKSDLPARGVRYNLDKNLDDIPTFRPDDYEVGPLVKLGILPPKHDTEWTATEER